MQENKDFNAKMIASTNKFDHIEIMDGMILIGLLKYAGEQTNDGKLLEVKLKPMQSEGGQPITRIEDWSFSTRAVIIKLPPVEGVIGEDAKERLKRFSVGDIVWIATGMMVDPNKRFIEDRTTPVTEFGGFLSIPMSAIQCKEWKMPQTKKDLVARETIGVADYEKIKRTIAVASIGTDSSIVNTKQTHS
jgi:hypothetical protein